MQALSNSEENLTLLRKSFSEKLGKD